MKVLAIGVVVVFVGYWMIQSPDTLANFTRDGASTVWDATETVFTSLMDFLGTLFK